MKLSVHSESNNILSFLSYFKSKYFFETRCQIIYQVNKIKLTRLAVCGVRGTSMIFNTNMLIIQAKVDLDEKTLFGKNGSSFSSTI